jgi:tetratricopeptide (TPR) repeat protein
MRVHFSSKRPNRDGAIAMYKLLGERTGLLLTMMILAAPGLWPQADLSKTKEIQAHLEKAQEALQSNNFAAAEREFEAVVTLDPNDLDARANMGVMRFFQNDWAGAAAQFRKVLEVQPKMWKVQASLGMCEVRLGHVADAQRLLEAALPHLTNGPFETQAGLELAEIDYQRGDLDGAVEVVRILLPNSPTNVDVLYTTARVYADLANRSRDALLLTAPESGRTHQLMAEVLINRGDSHAAMVQYRRALEVDPRVRGVHYELGEAILQGSRQASALEAAEKEFRAALAENPGDANAEYWLGIIYSLRGAYQTAIEHYSRALQLSPNDADAHQALGAAWIKLRKPEKALEHLLAATRLDPLFPTAHYQLGTVYRQLGRESEARAEIAAFEKLEKARKETSQVYSRTREGFSDVDPNPADTPNNQPQ